MRRILTKNRELTEVQGAVRQEFDRFNKKTRFQIQEVPSIRYQSYSAKFGELVRIDPTKGAMSIFLPRGTEADIGKVVEVVNVTNSTNTIDVKTVNSAYIGSSSYYRIEEAYKQVSFKLVKTDLWISFSKDNAINYTERYLIINDDTSMGEATTTWDVKKQFRFVVDSDRRPDKARFLVGLWATGGDTAKCDIQLGTESTIIESDEANEKIVAGEVDISNLTADALQDCKLSLKASSGAGTAYMRYTEGYMVFTNSSTAVPAGCVDCYKGAGGGGGNITIQNDGTTVLSNAETINFKNVNAVLDSGTKVNVTHKRDLYESSLNNFHNITDVESSVFIFDSVAVAASDIVKVSLFASVYKSNSGIAQVTTRVRTDDKNSALVGKLTRMHTQYESRNISFSIPIQDIDAGTRTIWISVQAYTGQNASILGSDWLYDRPPCRAVVEVIKGERK